MKKNMVTLVLTLMMTLLIGVTCAFASISASPPSWWQKCVENHSKHAQVEVSFGSQSRKDGSYYNCDRCKQDEFIPFR